MRPSRLLLVLLAVAALACRDAPPESSLSETRSPNAQPDIVQALREYLARLQRDALAQEARRQSLKVAELTEEETAAALGVSRSTVQRGWIRARAWLRQEIGELGDPFK